MFYITYTSLAGHRESMSMPSYDCAVYTAKSLAITGLFFEIKVVKEA